MDVRGTQYKDAHLNNETDFLARGNKAHCFALDKKCSKSADFSHEMKGLVTKILEYQCKQFFESRNRTKCQLKCQKITQKF